MARVFCIPGIIFLFAALVLNFLVSVSLPYLPALDVARTGFPSSVQVSDDQISEVRFGVWSYCTYNNDGDRTCNAAGHGYTYEVRVQHDGDSNDNSRISIGSAWTRGLAVHPVATGVTFIAFVLSFSSHITITLLCSLISFLAAVITLIAFAIDIALYAYVKDKFNDVSGHTNTAPGFWLTFVSLILLLLAGCTVCFGRRRDRMSSASYPMTSVEKPWYKRFRRGAGSV